MQKTAFALVAAAALALTGGVARADLKIVATVPDLAALAREIGGKHASVTSMSLSTQDPHFVDARPNLALALNKADLLLLIGLDLEIGWLPVLLTGARNGEIQPGSRGYLDCSQFTRLLDIPRVQVDRSMGDLHAGGNPHYTKDPRAGADVAKAIATRMGELDPERSEQYQVNLKSFLERLEASRQKLEEAMAPYRGTPFIGYHMSWSYVADWLGLKPVILLEPKPGIPPNPSHAAKVVVVGRAQKAKLILQEEYYPDRTSSLIADKVGAPVLKLAGGTRFEAGQSYVQFIEENVGKILAALRKGG